MEPVKTAISLKLALAILGAAVVLVFGVVGVWRLVADNGEDKNKRNPPAAAAARDGQPPEVEFDNAASVSSGELSGLVTVTVSAADNVGVEKVEYYIDGVFFAVSYSPPFSLSLDTSALTSGEHQLAAKAYDKEGNVASSEEIKFTVAASGASEAPKAATGSSKNTSTGGSGGGSTPTPDTIAPSAPGGLMLSAGGPYVVNFSWTASTDNVGVSNYKVYRGGAQIGTASTTSYIDLTVVPGNTYEYSVKAFDAAGNSTISATEPSITLATIGIWMDFDTPEVFGNDGTPLELGVKFRPLVDGQITGIRFYKAGGDSGTHTGTLWASGGSSLATATFSGETASGWQQVTFSSPVSVTAGTTYVASYFTPQGRYGATSDYFATEGITSQYLTAMASGVDGDNGVFRAGSAGFPSSSFSDTNYWVDVNFAPSPAAGGPTATTADNSAVFSGFAGSNNTGIAANQRLPVRDREPILTTAGVTVSDVEIRHDDTILVEADNITFDNVKLVYDGPLDSIFTMVSLPVGVTGTTFSDCEIDGQSEVERAIRGIDGVTVQRCRIHHTGNGVEVSEDMTVADSYIHDIFTPSGLTWHADGIQAASTTSNITITGNTIFNSSGETSAINVVGGAGDTITDVLIEGNLLAGGGYTVYVGAGTTANFQATNNKFSTRFFPKVGGFNIWHPDFLSSVTVSGNTIYETGAGANDNL